MRGRRAADDDGPAASPRRRRSERQVTDIIRLTAAETAAKIASGELTAVEVAEAHLARIEAVDEKGPACRQLGREGALAQARAVYDKRERGEKLGPLACVPLALKDIFTPEGIPTT